MFTDNKGPPGCPMRFFSAPDVWRRGYEPDYTNVNTKYMAKENNNEPGGLEDIVSTLIKNWESEASHNGDPSKWSTIDYENWTLT
eukprot:UN08817